ncbi:unnamed protein product [Diamesa hyperborea]
MEARKKFNFILQNAMMKEFFEYGGSSEESSIFFRNHDFHRSNTLPNYKIKQQSNCCSNPCGICFPTAAPFAPCRQVPRVVVRGRPTDPTDVQPVSNKALHKLYTLKLKKKRIPRD